MHNAMLQWIFTCMCIKALATLGDDCKDKAMHREDHAVKSINFKHLNRLMNNYFE